MQGPEVEAVESRVSAKARVASLQIAHELHFREFAFVGKTGIRVSPSLAADIVRQILDSRLRRRRRTQQAGPGTGHGFRGRNRPNRTHHDECPCNRGDDDCEEASVVHEATLSRTRFSRAVDGSTTRRLCHRLYGISTTNIARMLLPMGRIPHMSPCHRGGICGALTGTAGATSSLLQMVIVLSSRSSTLRQPAKTRRGS